MALDDRPDDSGVVTDDDLVSALEESLDDLPQATESEANGQTDLPS